MKQLVEEVKQYRTNGYNDTLISICGAGALGGNLAAALARRGFQRLRIIDRDWVEEQNLATQPFQPRDIGTPKALSLARSLYALAQAEADPLVVELTSQNASTLLAGSQLVVDALDNAAGRDIVAETCATLDVPCLHLAIDVDPRCGLLHWDAEKPATGDGRREDYPAPKTLADLMVDAGCKSIVQFLVTGEKQPGEVTAE